MVVRGMAEVAVIMPAYNAGKTIAESIESVLCQTFTDLELIVCDDGSSDETLDVINSYLKKDSRVSLTKNIFVKGAAGARNSCLHKSSSRYVAFLDSDDIWDENKVSTQISFMKHNNVAMSHSNYYMFDDGHKSKLICSPDVIGFDDIIKCCNIGCLTVMLDLEKIGSVRLPYSPKEDYAFWIAIMRKGIKSYCSTESISYYRKQSESLSSSKFKEIPKQWYVLREIGEISKFRAVFCISTYILNGLFKHYIKG